MYQRLRNAHRKLRKKIKLILKPEVSTINLRRFMQQVLNKSPQLHRHAPPTTISIIVPCYGHAPFLAEMFESIILQTRQPEKIIFVVDQSPDNTIEILTILIRQFQDKTVSQFEILENASNLGQAASLNRGIDLADTELVMILNDDDYLMHDCVEMMLNMFEKHPQVALIGGHCQAFGQNELPNLQKNIRDFSSIEQIQMTIHSPSEVKYYRSTNAINMTHSSSTFYKSAWEAIGGYYPNKEDRVVPNSDRDFQMRINALFPVGISYDIPLSCWRNYSSVDHGLNS